MEAAKSVIDQLDVDKDGKVSYPEFILVMKYKKWSSWLTSTVSILLLLTRIFLLLSL